MPAPSVKLISNILPSRRSNAVTLSWGKSSGRSFGLLLYFTHIESCDTVLDFLVSIDSPAAGMVLAAGFSNYNHCSPVRFAG